MKMKNWFQKLSAFFLLMTMMLSIVQPGLVDSVSARAVADDGVVYDPLTGGLAFVGSQPGAVKASPLADAFAQAPAQNATAFVGTYMKQLGLKNIESDLVVSKTFTEPKGRSSVRYEQRYQGIPVFGSQVIVNTDARGAMLSLTAKTSPNLNIEITPVLTEDEAVAAAVEAIAKYNNLEAHKLTASKPSLQIYDARLLNPIGAVPRLVWNLTVSAMMDGVNEVVLVDANNAAIALHYNQVDVAAAITAKESVEDQTHESAQVLGVPLISIYNLHHAAPNPNTSAGWPGTLVCNQSSKAACDGVGGDDLDAVNAYKNAADAYNFMKNYLKIDSFNNAGVATQASIHYGTGYKKNFWLTSRRSTVYGDGYAGADDMAGHAIGFGLLEFSSASTALTLAYQPGAIAESLSDMWGEFIDQTNGRGTDTAAVKWLMGENWPDGVQRNMKNPAAAPYNDPDKMTSPNFYLGDDNTVGIYINAGVNNKAVYLMTDGGTFNGRTITGLGIAKVARIYYEVEKYLLSPSSTYFDLYYAVKQACHNLVGKSSGIFAQDCDQVRNALDAVEMNLTRSATIYPVAKFCPTGISKGKPTLFADSFESGLAKWTTTNVPSPTDVWKVVARSATNGFNHFEGPEPGKVSMAAAQTTNAVLIPGGYKVYLFFEHWFNFESLGASYHDGGLLYYTIDNGATWKNASTLFATGQNYNGTIASGFGNPVQGQKAFVGFVRSYVSTNYDLTSLAGKQVKFRWVMASDNAVSGSGWYIDNIQIYRCVALPGIPAQVSPAANALQTTFTPTLDWSNVTPDLDHYVVQVATDTAFKVIVYQATTTTTSVHKLTKALAANKKYYWRVRAYNAGNDAKAWSTVRAFRTALAPPVLQSPINANIAGSVRPIFNWTDVPGATGYTIQVSPVSTFASLAINATISTATSTYRHPTNLTAAKMYYWRVRTNGINGPSAWSIMKGFKTP